jgi:hypothetical protein
MKRTAVDEEAKKYWEKLYGEYGRAWVRDIPRRIKAALADNDMSRSAAGEETPVVRPFVSVKDGDKLVIEGTYHCDGENMLFCAKINVEDGTIRDLDAVPLPAAQ